MSSEHTLSRRAFTVGAATIGTAALTRGVTSRAATLGKRYASSGEPQVSVAYPEDWFLRTDLVAGVVLPKTAFSVSSEPLEPAAPILGTTPNYTRLSPDGVLVHAEIYPLSEDEGYLPGMDVSQGFAMERMTLIVNDDTYPEIDKRIAWYVGTGFGYLISLFSGQGRPDLDTASEVIKSISVTE